jgi:hypothetical protein
VKKLADSLSFIPYQLKTFSSVLVVGSGGGIDVARAYLGGSRHVDAVEINPLLIKRLNRLIPRDKNVYHLPGVNLKVREARHFVSKSGDYDLISVISAKGYGGAGIKGSVFLQDYLYTKEAVALYLHHLTPDGVLFLKHRRSIIARYVSTVMKVLEENGLEPRDHMIVITPNLSESGHWREKEDHDKAVILVKKTPIQPAELSLFKQRADLVIQSLPRDRLAQSVVTDDHPFTRYRLRFKAEKDRKGACQGEECPDWQNKVSRKNRFVIDKKDYLKNYYVVLILITIILVGLLMIFIRRVGGGGREKRKCLFAAGYFFCVGAGFIILELGFINKLTLFLINPALVIATVLCSIFFGGSWGGRVVSRFSMRWADRLVVCAVSLLGVFVYVFFRCYPWVLGHSLDFSMPARIFIAVCLMGVPGLLMGVLFPLGLRCLSEEGAAVDVPYMMGINGLASVWGSLFSVVISWQWGFSSALAVGMIFYFSAIIFFGLWAAKAVRYMFPSKL